MPYAAITVYRRASEDVIDEERKRSVSAEGYGTDGVRIARLERRAIAASRHILMYIRGDGGRGSLVDMMLVGQDVVVGEPKI